VTEQLPSWPTAPPTYGSVVLREFTDEDAHLAVELGDDPYIPLIGSLPALPTAEQALAWLSHACAQQNLAMHRRISHTRSQADGDVPSRSLPSLERPAPPFFAASCRGRQCDAQR
jgi:hypothetical protein